MLIPVLLAVAVLAGDIVTKLVVAGRLELGSSVPVIDGVLHWTNVSNPGMAFGLLGNHRWVFLLLSAVLIAAIAWFFLTQKNYAKAVYIDASLIVGGGIGNMIDRFVTFGTYDNPGCVVDFIDFCAFPNVWKWTFNVADTAITVGAALFVIYLLFYDKKAYQNGKKAVLYEEKKPKNGDRS